MVTGKQLYFESCHFLALAGIPYRYNQCHTILEGLNSVCAKLEPATSKNNDILETNVLQKFNSHALFQQSEGPLAVIIKETACFVFGL